MIVLGIETSCDETSVAIVKKKNRLLLGDVLSENTLSQVKKHKKFGGVVPELASREHSNTIDYLVKKTLKESGLSDFIKGRSSCIRFLISSCGIYSLIISFLLV